MLVLLWGLATDSPVAAIRDELRACDVPTLFVNQQDIAEIEVRMMVGDSLDASVRVQGKWVGLSQITAAYLRPYSSSRLPEIARSGPASPAWQHAAAVDDILLTWAEVTPALLVNPLGAMAGNSSKPYQLEQLRKIGWRVPDTLVTTDPEAVRKFWEEHQEVIYKSVSGIRSQVSRLRPEHLDRFDSISSCPTQFQQFIRGVDHRIHVIGDEVLACRVVSDVDDYRYPGEGNVEIEACALPFDVEDLCLKTSAALELPFVGIDLRLTPEGEWVCFEANPSPGFTYYESATGLPIGRAVVNLLIGARAVDFPESEPVLSSHV